MGDVGGEGDLAWVSACPVSEFGFEGAGADEEGAPGGGLGVEGLGEEVEAFFGDEAAEEADDGGAVGGPSEALADCGAGGGIGLEVVDVDAGGDDAVGFLVVSPGALGVEDGLAHGDPAGAAVAAGVFDPGEGGRVVFGDILAEVIDER